MTKIMKIHPDDNVAVAIERIGQQETFCADGETVTALAEIPAGHKIALKKIEEKTPVIKYGCPIGYASQKIEKGEWVHTHNLKTGLGDLLEYSYEPVEPAAIEKREAYFYGFERPDKKVGVRNEIWIIPTVGCVNNVAEAIAKKAAPLVRGSVDDVVAFPHPYGCSQMGDDQEYTRTILADLVNHPNAGGVLVLGLGCENSNIDVLKTYIGDYDEKRVKFLVCQESDDEMADGMMLVGELIDHAASFQRGELSANKLIIG